MTNRGRPSRAVVYERLEQAITELHGRFGGLPSPHEAQSIWDDIWHQEAHHSTALEGNTLVLREVLALLDQGRAVGAKELREYNEVRGYADAARWVYGQALESRDWYDGQLVSLSEIRHVHHAAMTPVWDVAPPQEATPAEAPGHFRQHDIRPFGGGMAPPTWSLVQPQIDGWVQEVYTVSELVRSARPGRAPLPELLARLHNEFERIHPFLDGNGRVGRLLLNLILVRLGYPPAIIFKRQRDSYLAALQRADAGDCGALGELIARAMSENLNKFIVPNVAGPARLVPLTALVTADVTMTALQRAAQRGRLKAVTGSDGIWRSTRKDVDAYLASRHQRHRS